MSPGTSRLTERKLTPFNDRSVSYVRLLRTHHRSAMLEERLNGLAMLALHKDISLNYVHDAVVEEYWGLNDSIFQLLA